MQACSVFVSPLTAVTSVPSPHIVSLVAGVLLLPMCQSHSLLSAMLLPLPRMLTPSCPIGQLGHLLQIICSISPSELGLP